MIPEPEELILLALAAYRTWRLLAEDYILDRPRRWLTRLGPKWQKQGDPVPKDYREKLGEFISCPACFGFWISIGWYIAWVIFPYETLVVAAAAAISSLVIYQRHKLDPPED